METKKWKLNRKKAGEAVLFLGIMFLTFYTLLRGQNLGEIVQAVKHMSVPYLSQRRDWHSFLCVRREV